MREKIGEIVLGDKAYLSDPCYGEHVCNEIINVIPGTYNVYITRCESLDIFYKGRVSSIFAIHKDYSKKYNKLSADDRENLWCSVDSGTCGIFDYDYFVSTRDDDDVDEEWYEKHIIGRMKDYLITDGKGAVSSSGVGDGTYPVYAEYDKNKAYSIRIKFL